MGGGRWESALNEGRGGEKEKERKKEKEREKVTIPPNKTNIYICMYIEQESTISINFSIFSSLHLGLQLHPPTGENSWLAS